MTVEIPSGYEKMFKELEQQYYIHLLELVLQRMYGSDCNTHLYDTCEGGSLLQIVEQEVSWSNAFFKIRIWKTAHTKVVYQEKNTLELNHLEIRIMTDENGQSREYRYTNCTLRIPRDERKGFSLITIRGIISPHYPDAQGLFQVREY